MDLLAVAKRLDDDRVETVDITHLVVVLAADVVAELGVVGGESIVFG